MEYAEEYMNEFKLYFNSPNRKNHFPYIYRVLLAGNDISSIKSLCSFNINS
jgi:antitoxin YefM